MNIKKIIKEEMSDFGWMEDTNYLSYSYLVGKALYFEPSLNEESFEKVMDVLKKVGFRDGFSWYNNFTWDSPEYGPEEIVGLYLDSEDSVVWTGWISEDYQEHIEEYAEESVEVLNGWDLLKGSIDENFDWTTDIPESKPLISDNGMSMTLSYTDVEKLLGGDFYSGTKEHFYKDIPVKDSLGKFTVKVYFYQLTSNGVPFWRVLGRSGDYGWGYASISKRNILGKRVRQQVFNVILKDLYEH